MKANVTALRASILNALGLTEETLRQQGMTLPQAVRFVTERASGATVATMPNIKRIVIAVAVVAGTLGLAIGRIIP